MSAWYAVGGRATCSERGALKLGPALGTGASERSGKRRHSTPGRTRAVCEGAVDECVVARVSSDRLACLDDLLDRLQEERGLAIGASAEKRVVIVLRRTGPVTARGRKT